MFTMLNTVVRLLLHHQDNVINILYLSDDSQLPVENIEEKKRHNTKMKHMMNR